MDAVSVTIQALLNGSPNGVTELVGERIEPIIAPTVGELPDVVVNQITQMEPQLLGGAACYPSCRVRIECRARSVTQAINLGNAVITQLRDLKGSFAGLNVTSFLQEETDETDHSEDFSTYRRIIDFSVRFTTA